MCDCGCKTNSVSQTFDELEFERGLWFAAQYGDLDRAKYLLDKGFHVDHRDAAGYTALHYAARNGHLSLCKLLLDRGAKVNATTIQGQATPLHRAASVGKYDIVKYLLEHKADCSLKDADGKTVLHRAAENQHQDICELVIKTNDNLKNEVDNKNKRPLDYAQSVPLCTILN